MPLACFRNIIEKENFIKNEEVPAGQTAQDNREKGAKPLRSRRCNGGVVSENATGKPGRTDTMRIPEPEDLPFMMGNMGRVLPASVTSDGRVRKAVLFQGKMTDLFFKPAFVCVMLREAVFFYAGTKGREQQRFRDMKRRKHETEEKNRDIGSQFRNEL